MRPNRARRVTPGPGKFPLKWMGVLLLLLTVLPPGIARAQSNPRACDLAKLHEVTSLDDWMAYLPDPDHQYTRQSALACHGWQPLARARLGYLDYPVWTRLRVTNSADGPKTAVLFNQRPMLNHLDVWVLDGNKVATHKQLGFMVSSHAEEIMANRLSHIVLSLPAGAAMTVLACLETRGVMEAGWEAATPALFSLKSLKDFLLLGLYAGIMLPLIIHGLVSWFAFRRIRFGLFVGYALSFLLLILSVNGFTRIVGLGISARIWFAGAFLFFMCAIVFWILFTQLFLRTAKTMPRMHRWLNILSITFVPAVVSYILGPRVPEAYQLTPLWAVCALIACATIPAVGILAVYRKLAYGRLYLLGYAPAFIASGVLVVVAQTSLIGRFSTALLIIPWVVIIHVMVMELSLGMMARRARSNLAGERRIAMEQSRFTVVGETIGMVVHQWRTPLARLGTQLMELHAYFRNTERLMDHETRIRDELLPAMNHSMQVLTDTVGDFSDFFSAKRPREDFDPLRAMDQALEILSARCAGLGLTIVRPETPEPVILHGHPTTLAHVMMVLLGNALDVLETRRVAMPRVILGLEETESEIILTVTDNGGGVDLYPIDKVFETFVSEKGRSHMGMGLGIARRLVEERMGGTIRADNLNGGTRFTLRLPHRG